MKHLVLLFAFCLLSLVIANSQENKPISFSADPDLVQFHSEIKGDEEVFKASDSLLSESREISYFVIISKQSDPDYSGLENYLLETLALDKTCSVQEHSISRQLDAVRPWVIHFNTCSENSIVFTNNRIW